MWVDGLAADPEEANGFLVITHGVEDGDPLEMTGEAFGAGVV